MTFQKTNIVLLLLLIFPSAAWEIERTTRENADFGEGGRDWLSVEHEN